METRHADPPHVPGRQATPGISGEDFATIFHATVAPTALLRIEDARVLVANAAFARLFGLTVQSIAGRSWDELAAPSAGDGRALEGGAFSLARSIQGSETSFTTPDGATHEFILSATTLGMDGERRLIVTMLDVTERKRAERAAKASLELFSLAFQTSAEAMGITRVRDDVILEVNDAFPRLLGVTRDEIVGRTSAAVGIQVKDADRAAVLASLARDGVVRGVELAFSTPQGERRHALLSLSKFTVAGEPCRFFTAVDITAHKRAVEAAKESAQLFAVAFRGSAQAMGMARARDDIIFDVNDAFPPLMDTPRENIVGKTAAETGIKIDPAQRASALASLASEGMVRDLEVPFLTPRGEHRDMLVTISLFTFGGEPCRFFTAVDITERKKMERALRAANADLDAFTSTVAHDLRAPLRAMSNLASVLLDDHAAGLGDDGRRLLTALEHETLEANALVEHLLAFSRLGAAPLARSRVDAEGIARAAVAELEGEAQRHHTRVRVLPMPPCDADAALLRQVYANLVANAIKYSSVRAEPEVIVGWRPEGGGAYFVQDNGIGFDMAHSAKLFTLFHRLTQPQGIDGTGVGLALCRRIIEKHRGRIWAEATPDKGATFYFTIPAAP